MLKFGRDRCILSVLIQDFAAMKKELLSLPIILLVVVGFCFAGSLALDDDLLISLEVKQVEKLTTTSLNYVFYLNIKNVSSKSYYLTRYRYRFVVNEMEYLQISTPFHTGLPRIGEGNNFC